MPRIFADLLAPMHLRPRSRSHYTIKLLLIIVINHKRGCINEHLSEMKQRIFFLITIMRWWYKMYIHYEKPFSSPARGWASRAESMLPKRLLFFWYHSKVILSPSIIIITSFMYEYVCSHTSFFIKTYIYIYIYIYTQIWYEVYKYVKTKVFTYTLSYICVYIHIHIHIHIHMLIHI